MYGTQANSNTNVGLMGFENDVKMYGTQASPQYLRFHHGLRMM